MRTRLTQLAAGWIGILLVSGALAQHDGRAQVERRLTSVGTLIEKSSGAKQVESSGNAEARARHNAARELHKQAAQALQAGDQPEAARLLDDAAKTMVEAVRLASPEQVTAQKEKRDFDAKMQSTRALLEAQKRIAAEKHHPNGQTLAQTLEPLLQEASRLAAGADLAGARKPLDQAYLASKAAVANMRGGETLVRSLNFASKEEEYRYELDRNDTHQMLIEVLLQDRRSNAAIDDRVRKALGEAGRLRKSAEEQAAKRDFEAGIKTLEQSTKELVKAIRSAGVYIPG